MALGGKMKFHILVLILGSLLILSCGSTEKYPTNSSSLQPTGHSPHFRISMAPENWESYNQRSIASGDPRQDCQEQLRKAICLTTADENDITGAVGWNKVHCDPKSDQFLPQLMEYYDELPNQIRPTFCTLKKIFISDGIDGLEFTGGIVNADGTKPVGAYIGIQKANMSINVSTGQIVTWKEQRGVFGQGGGFLKSSAAYPQVSYNLKMSVLKEDGFYYVITHELGHVIDFYNCINSTMWVDGQKPCKASQAGWAGMSWGPHGSLDSGTPLKEAAFYRQKDLCWEGACDPNHLPKLSEALTFYQSIQKSAFITAYSGFDESEDFAESWAWYLALHFKSPNYKVVIPGHATLDMNGMFTSSPLLVEKQKFIDDLWHNPKFKLTP